MVNESSTPSTKARVLAILRNSSKPVSGETIAASLSVSRVAVWKAVQTLTEAGYGITAGNGGYSLVTDREDSLDPCEFAGAEQFLRHWKATDSTMNRAREAALGAAPSGLVIVADAQTSGRGTAHKRWDSVPGGLFFTVVTRPRLDSVWSHRQVLAAQCALIRSIKAVSTERAYLAWPNDIIIDTDAGAKKFGGILAEGLFTGYETEFINLGIGINTGLVPPSAGYGSLRARRKDLLATFLREFNPAQYADESLPREWNALCPHVGRPIAYRVRAPFEIPLEGGTDAPPGDFPREAEQGRERTGVFLGVDGMGFALVEEGASDSLNGENPIARFSPHSISILNKGRNS